MIRSGVILAALLWAGQAAAHDFERCEKPEIAAVLEALTAAEKIALRAAVSIGDTPEFALWFGAWSKENGATVRSSFKAIHAAIRDNDLKVVCANVGEDDCNASMYANVFRHDAYAINLCPSFFGMPEIHAHSNTSAIMENGTRAGTIIHEVSHFDVVAGTDDLCYTRTDCAAMALTRSLVRNADSYQYFAEDVAALPRD
ncbi:M35 family metallo-endopeptidase [Histidinibacterium aquaticum]|uniref:Protease n=1 Tax=Histidinibacterium aquaticum TaxID=2613962 RepID=A0A5J5GNF1_9RHOB|nr:M35 family metallo-endopeptidase [Histidinibacterium aquaticum]KAA9009819.1 protease [Histidinibacterium aquaticum]